MQFRQVFHNNCCFVSSESIKYKTDVFAPQHAASECALWAREHTPHSVCVCMCFIAYTVGQISPSGLLRGIPAPAAHACCSSRPRQLRHHLIALCILINQSAHCFEYISCKIVTQPQNMLHTRLFLLLSSYRNATLISIKNTHASLEMR